MTELKKSTKISTADLIKERKELVQEKSEENLQKNKICKDHSQPSSKLTCML
jgi:hypothetical protein